MGQPPEKPPSDVGGSPPRSLPEGVTELRPDHLEHLRASGLSDAIIRERGYVTVLGPVGAGHLEPGFSKAQRKHAAGIAYPVYHLGHLEASANGAWWKAAHHWELRPDGPRTLGGKLAKYERPRGSSNAADVLPRFRPLLADPSRRLWITEGAKKADALADLGEVAVNLGGVWNFRGKNASGGKAVLAGLREEIAWNDREVILAFDSDWDEKRQVLGALRRAADMVAGWGATVHALHLPKRSDGSKTGLDDFVAQLPDGERLDALLRHTKPFADRGGLPPEKLGVNPETGRVLYNPANWSGGEDSRLTYAHPNGRVETVYTGVLAVVATGTRDDGTEELVVRFGVGSRVETVTAPSAELARARGVIDHLAARGANVHEENARKVAAYLRSFAALNADALPRRQLADHYGRVDGGIVGPGWSVGASAVYTGREHVEVLTDPTPYRAALEEAATWGPPAWPVFLLVGLAIASPHLEYLRTRRNPVVSLSGGSNSGKTTAAEFASGIYGNPETRPLRIEGGRTTVAGLMQTLEGLGGLPAFVDEAHVLNDYVLRVGVYGHANGESYTRGGRDGHATGGSPLRGVLVLAGELPPELGALGAHNRLLRIETAQHPIFGLESAPARADLLRTAVINGHGAVGRTLTAEVWTNRTAWAADVRSLADSLTSSAREWHPHLAAAEVSVLAAWSALNLDGPPPRGIAEQALRALEAGRREHDPIGEAFEALRAAVLAIRPSHDNPDHRHDRGAFVAKHDKVSGEYLVNPRAEVIRAALEGFGGLPGLAAQWARRGLVLPASDGKGTRPRRIPDHGLMRVLVIPEQHMDPEAAAIGEPSDLEADWERAYA